MTQFDNREKAFERKFAMDAEIAFKANARRNKLLGLWAAELMGLDADTAQVYAVDVIKSDLEEPGEEDVYRKVMGDLEGKGVEVSEHRLRREMADLLEEAYRQVAAAAGKLSG
jgi:hypothetical protein